MLNDLLRFIQLPTDRFGLYMRADYLQLHTIILLSCWAFLILVVISLTGEFSLKFSISEDPLAFTLCRISHFQLFLDEMQIHLSLWGWCVLCQCVVAAFLRECLYITHTKHSYFNKKMRDLEMYHLNSHNGVIFPAGISITPCVFVALSLQL